MFTRTYGVEIECMLPAGQTLNGVAQAITEAGVDCYAAGYTHAVSQRWKIVTDGSLRGGNGMEIVSPPLRGEAGFEAIRKVSSVLVRIGARVNTSCGLHVHVDARNLPVPAMRKLAALYIENETVIDSLLPPSRRGNANVYCNSLRNTNMATLRAARTANDIANAIMHGNRYVKLNYTAFWRHGTVEFRHHSGTVEAEKIIRWTQACLRMVATAVKEQDQPITVATSERPRDRRLAKIYDLMVRPEGCTRAEVAQVLGRRTMPPMNRILREAGMTYRAGHRVGDRRTEVYWLMAQPTTNPNATAATLASFTDKLEMAAEERQFWVARAAYLAAARTTVNQLGGDR